MTASIGLLSSDKDEMFQTFWVANDTLEAVYDTLMEPMKARVGESWELEAQVHRMATKSVELWELSDEDFNFAAQLILANPLKSEAIEGWKPDLLAAFQKDPRFKP